MTKRIWNSQILHSMVPVPGTGLAFEMADNRPVNDLPNAYSLDPSLLPQKTEVPLPYSHTPPALKAAQHNVTQLFSISEHRANVPFEEAIALVGHGIFHIAVLFVCGGCITATICELLGVGYLLPAAACDLHMNDNDKGLLGAIAFIGMICGSHFWGYLADTTGRRRVIALTLVVDVLLAVAATLVPSYEALVVLRFLCGFFMTAPQAVAYAYLGEFHTPVTRSAAFVWAAVFPGIGLIYLPGLAWGLLSKEWVVDLPWIQVVPWRLFVLLMAVPSLLSALGVLALPESPKFLLNQGKAEDALEVLRYIYAINNGRPPQEYPVSNLAIPAMEGGGTGSGSPKSVLTVVRSVWSQTAPLFTPKHAWSTFLALFIMFGIIAGANGLPTWLPELFNRMALWEVSNPGNSTSLCGAVEGLGGMSSEEACQVETAVFENNLYVGVAALLVPVLTVLLVKPLGSRNLLIGSLLLTGACGLGLNWIPSSVGFLVLSCIVCAVTEMCISLFSGIAVEMFPTKLRAMAVSLSLMCGRLGSIVGNFMFGALLQTSCSATFYALGGVLLACGAFSFGLPRHGKFQH